MLMEKLPRLTLASLPTPLQEARRLTATLGGPRIFIKRDDLTGLALGGNKTRKLEFVMAEAKRKSADVIITTGGSQSNHACLTAAAGCKLGMEVILVLFSGAHTENQGNLLLDTTFGAEVELVKGGVADQSVVQDKIEKLVAALRSKGRKPYVVPVGAFTPLGTVGYVKAASEICEQLKEKRLTAQHVFVTVGTGGTMAGLLLGAKYFEAPFHVVGVNIGFKKERITHSTADMANETAKLLDMDVTLMPEDVTIYDEYMGNGYGVPTTQCIEAIRLVAQTEGIILDPVYTGKAMSGLIDLIHQGRFNSGDTIIFMHTGGVPGVFAYNNELLVQKPIP